MKEKRGEHQLDLKLFLYIDLHQASDANNRPVMIQNLITPPKKIVSLIKHTMEITIKAFEIENKKSDTFCKIMVSAVSFSVTLQSTLNNMNTKRSINNKSKQIDAYADDIVIVGRNKRAIVRFYWENIRLIDNETKTLGLVIIQGNKMYVNF